MNSFFFGLTFAPLPKDPKTGQKSINLTDPVNAFKRSVMDWKHRTESMQLLVYPVTRQVVSRSSESLKRGMLTRA